MATNTGSTHLWRSDAELRLRSLEIDDPHQQQGICNHIPEGSDVVRIINTYSYSRYPQDKAYCSKCESKRHKYGFTAELSDGSFVLLGKDCGEKIWPEKWADVAKLFKGEQERAATLLAFDRAVPEMQMARQELESWRAVVSCVARHQRAFQNQMSEWFLDFRLAARRDDHRLFVHEQVRDLLSEADYERRYGERPPRAFYRSEQRTMLHLSGGAFFDVDKPDSLFELALVDLDTAIAVARITGEHTQRDLQLSRRRVLDAHERLDRVARCVRALSLFYSRDHLTKVAWWMNAARPDPRFGQRYEAREQGIADIGAGRILRLPEKYGVLDATPLKRLDKIK